MLDWLLFQVFRLFSLISRPSGNGKSFSGSQNLMKTLEAIERVSRRVPPLIEEHRMWGNRIPTEGEPLEGE